MDPGLGSSGLGRLAACYLDSLATLQYPATGYGIRYDYGIFTQSIDTDGAQRESASTWLRLHNVWETPRSDARYIVRFGGRVLTTHDVGGVQRSRWVETQDILAVGFDQLVPGNPVHGHHLRLFGRALRRSSRISAGPPRRGGDRSTIAYRRLVSRRFHAPGQELRFKRRASSSAPASRTFSRRTLLKRALEELRRRWRPAATRIRRWRFRS